MRPREAPGNDRLSRFRAGELKKSSPPPRKLHHGHFAFMRALAQGLDERASWERYLRYEGEHADLRTVRRMIASIRDEFAAAARRENKPGTARLILLDPDRFASKPKLPSLAEFAVEAGLEDFSEAEQIEAYEAAYPSGVTRESVGAGQERAGRSSRRARVIERQLEALRWLQDLVAQHPRPGDSVAAWLNPSVAGRLERLGVRTLRALVEHINSIGARWWVQVPGVGERKAARVLDWLRANEAVLGLRVGDHVGKPRRQLAPATLAGVVPAATAIVPYEKFVPPEALDGSAGLLRAPPGQCLLRAANDHEAIGAWLASKRQGEGGAGLSATQRAYRKEAERLLLWSILERRKALSSLSTDDATAYFIFLQHPPESWCGPRHLQRWSPMWRPLEGPLNPASLRQSLIILRSLFEFLVDQGYLSGNPFAVAALHATPRQPQRTGRTLSFAQWDHVETMLQDHGDTEPQRRLRRGMRWLRATGLRVSEITRAKCEDLALIEHMTTGGASATGWLLHVIDRGGRSRQVPLPPELVDELGDELARHGFDRQVGAVGNRDIHVLARFDARRERPPGWTASGLYQAIKTFLADAAEGLGEADARQLRTASTHWLRRSHDSHARQGKAGRSSVPRHGMQDPD
jgi:integrase